MKFEETILRHLVHNEQYARKVLPFLRPDYFPDKCDRNLFEKIGSFFTKYNKLPSSEALDVELQSQKGLTQEEFSRSTQILDSIRTKPDEVTSEDWLLENTEKFCQERAIANAIMGSIAIIQGEDKIQTKETIPELLKGALAVSFDSHIGHDFLEDSDHRFDFYHRKEEKVPFDLEYMNKITCGGFSRKSLNIILAGTGVGKTLIMAHMASANLMQGNNVLYITMELSEERLAERIDANLLNTMIKDLRTLPEEEYVRKVSKVRSRTPGKLIIKEYPTASAHVGHFRHLLNELHLKKNFVPDIIYIDYLNICCSSRIKQGSNINSYTYIKSIAEEFRGLAVEKNVPIVSATQTTRSGYDNSDVSITDTSESFGLPATADFMMAAIQTDDLEELGQYKFKQLKNRYDDMNLNKNFVVGVDKARMRLFDVEESAQAGLHEGPVMDNAKFGQRDDEERKMKWATKTMGRKDFSGLKT